MSEVGPAGKIFFVGGSDVTFVNSSKVIVRVKSQVWFLNKLVNFSVMFLAA